MTDREAEFFNQKLRDLRQNMTEEGQDDLGYPIAFDPDALSFHVDPSLLFGLERLGEVRGKKILDCGCGSGFSTIYLAKKGARVHAFDLSEEAVAVTQKRASLNGVSGRVSVLCSSLHSLPYPDRFFDAMFGSFILHHVDLPPAMEEIRRVLKQEGQAVFVENSSRNPLLMAARRHLVGRLWIPKKGSADEHPLTPEEIDLLKSRFTVTIRYADFVFFRMMDYVLPYPFFQKMGFWMDRVVYRLFPRIRPFSYYLVCELTPKADG